MRRLLWVVPTVLALAGTALAGCGGGGDRLSASEFRTRANAVCTEGNDDLDALVEDLPDEPEAEDVQQLVEDIVPIADRMIEDLRELEPPEDLEARYDEALESAEAARDRLDEASESPEASMELFESESDPFEESNQKFDEVGLSACAGENEGDDAGGGSATSVTVTADEYSFALEGGMQVAAGEVEFVLRNAGDEDHEIGFVKLKEGATVEQVLQVIGEGGDETALIEDDEVGGTEPVEPGQEDSVTVDLTAGSYAYACFIEAPDGEPHAAKGMYGQLTVA
jgi:uncharacterized cupredoxin-like copper-binding protein